LNKILILFFVSGVSLFASSGGEVDIVPRTINFLIFAAIVYYLVAEPIKGFFSGRSSDIASSFELIQKKLKEAKDEKIAAQKYLDEARVKASEMMQDVKKEAVLVRENMQKQLKIDIAVLHKQKDELKEIDRNHMIRAVVKNSIEDMFQYKELDVDRKVTVNSLVRKVA
jgi:F-type H+-transporting ATPase subunit b